MAERIPIGADHAGFEMKGTIAEALGRLGFEVQDMGTHSAASTDYADYAHQVAHAVETGEAARGVLLCGTGLGMSYAANRHPHVRAAVAWAPEIAASGGNVYVTWSDDRSGDSDVLFNYSNNNGVTWQSSALRVEIGRAHV